MTYLGNQEILKIYKVAFFCSQKCPAEVILKSFDWAIEQRDKGVCVITAAHSPVERDVFYFLLKGKQPLILVRENVPIKTEDSKILDAVLQQRLLIINHFSSKRFRPSKRSSYLRNRFIIQSADEIVNGYSKPEGMIEKLLKQIDGKKITSLSGCPVTP